jgi:hypothetical protein
MTSRKEIQRKKLNFFIKKIIDIYGVGLDKKKKRILI